MSISAWGDLVTLLGDDLRRPGVTCWLAEADLAGPGAPVLLGRLLRSGDLRPRSRQRLRGLLAASGKLLLAAADRASKIAGDGAVARDDAESVLVLLGEATHAGDDAAVASAEQSLARLLADVDERAESADDDAPITSRSPWLDRIAPLDVEAWWLVPVFLARVSTPPLRAAIEARRSAASEPAPASAPLRLPRRALEHGMSAALGEGEPGGVDRILERPLDAVIATLGDGAIEVYAHGLGEAEQGPPGFVVRHARGAFDSIESVELDPPAPEAPYRSRLDLAVWVPLAGASVAPRRLVVKWRDEAAGSAVIEESLPLEFD